MANTFIEPGDWTFEEMLKDTKRGVYIKSYMEWNIDDKRLNQRYVGLEAYLIENGSLKEAIKDPVLEITTPRYWGSIDARANDLQYTCGTCGKGDPMQGSSSLFRRSTYSTEGCEGRGEMMSEQAHQQEVARLALDEALKLGCEDVSVLCAVSNENQVRFANNSITLVNSVRNITLEIYLALAKKRYVGFFIQSHNSWNTAVRQKSRPFLQGSSRKRGLRSTAARAVQLQISRKF